jgi:hypothetical protein
MLMADAAPFGATITKRKLDLDAVIAELGKVELSPLHRRQLCKALAKQLGVPVAMLAQVGQPETEKARNTVAFTPDPNPWPEPVSGAQLLRDLGTVLTKHLVLGDNSVLRSAFGSY